MKARLLIISVLLATFAMAGVADASWQANSGSGSAYAKARSVAGGNTPTASVSNRNVTVSWSAAGGTVPLDGYVVRRFDTGGTEATVGASCSGIVNALNCTETNVDPGNWRYTVTPARQNWRGAQSAQSTAVTVNSPAMTLGPNTVHAVPAALTGQITNFKSGQTVTFRLDNPTTGTVLTGSIAPTPVPANGTANLSVTLPAGTSNGAHNIYAIGNTGDQASASVTVTRPLVTGSVIAKTAGGDPGFIRQGGQYFIYANVSGTGNPPAGLSTLRANVSNVTTGQNNVAMTNGSFSVDGQSYNYRSAALTATNPQAAGSKSYTLTLTDTAASTTVTNHSVTVDNTAPTAADLQATNVAGGTQSELELGDTFTLTYSDPIDANSILAGWTGASTNVVVRLTNGNPDTLTVWNAANNAQLPLGTVNLGRTDYTLLGKTFGASGTPSTMERSGNNVTVTLGTDSVGFALTAGGTGTMTWTPSATATDRAGNAASTATATESGAVDRDF